MRDALRSSSAQLLLALSVSLTLLAGCDGDAMPDGGVDGGSPIDSGGRDAGTDAGSDASVTCGDGVVAASEGCDDGDAEAGDGCAADCAVESGFACTGEPSVCTSMCGDGVIAGEETCDDGGEVGGDGCSPTCTLEVGWTCDGAPSVCGAVCGDGMLLGAETCDDGDVDGGDGCDATCALETGWSCTGMPSSCAPICGDGAVVGTEGCDDGGTDDGDGCSAACIEEAGHACTGMPSSCVAVCGDGAVVGTETCDDGDTDDGDGCSASCGTEAGFTCTGEPSVCVAICGDGVVAGTEGCDDGGTDSLDGCSATCVPEPGYVCAGSPSLCTTVCGDGVMAGAEDCDDGNTMDGDDCRADCSANSGESCLDPLPTSSGATAAGRTTWTFAAGAAVDDDHGASCDPNGTGADMIFHVLKTTPTVAMGGSLLHVHASSDETSASSYLDIEITSGACTGASADVERCLWYARTWEAYLDVPAGDYYLHVVRNSTPAAGTPAMTVFAEEVPTTDPAAQGEGCFAPLTTASAGYTAPATAGAAHTWTLGPIASFDMGPSWGEPQSISCDDHATYGDIHGVDAVVRFDKASAGSVLLVEVQNLDPTLSASDLDVEVLAECDPLATPRVSRNCRANADSIAFTAGGPAGPSYIWLATEATGEVFVGAEVRVTELTLATGESWVVAQPLTGSGAIAPSSSRRFDAPSCFPATGNIHWYRYTATEEGLSFRPDAGPIALFDAEGQELSCATNGNAEPAAQIVTPGTTLHVAVMVGVSTAMTVIDQPYTGVRTATDMGITFPASATTDYGMTSAPGVLYLGGTSSLFEIPLTVGATAVAHDAADGITATQLGYDLVTAGSALFSVDSSAATGSSRIYRIYDGATWGPSARDLTPSYPTGAPSYTLASNGTTIFYASRRTTGSVEFWSLPAGAPATPFLLGSNTSVHYVVGLAVDTNYFYVASNGASGEGVYRVSRSPVSSAPTFLGPLNTSTLHTAIALDSRTAPNYLYVRDAIGDIHVFASPAGATPTALGVISTLGAPSDYGMTFDETTGALYFFETESDAAGRIVRLD